MKYRRPAIEVDAMQVSADFDDGRGKGLFCVVQFPDGNQKMMTPAEFEAEGFEPVDAPPVLAVAPKPKKKARKKRTDKTGLTVAQVAEQAVLSDGAAEA